MEDDPPTGLDFSSRRRFTDRIAPVINTAMNKLRKLLLSITLPVASISFCVKNTGVNKISGYGKSLLEHHLYIC